MKWRSTYLDKLQERDDAARRKRAAKKNSFR